VVLDIEVEGVKQIQASGFPARYVFIAPPSEEELEKRLRGRGTEKEESIQKRLKQAKVELEYSKVPDVHDRIIVNDVSLLSMGLWLALCFVLTWSRTWRRRTRSLRSSFFRSRQRALRVA
jgi:Mg-chelatase subunit ChlI